MSQENVERIKAGFAAHNSGDIGPLVEVYAPDAVFETLLLGTHHGNEAIRWIYEENQKTLSGYDVVPVELIDIGDKVVAVAQAVGAGPASEIAVDEPFAFVFTFKGSGWCENRPSETRKKPSKPWGCRSSKRERDGPRSVYDRTGASPRRLASMSASWSSTQSPGSRAVTIRFRPCARHERSSADIDKAR
jgi:ketosteroid isomerase-like protein